MCRAAGDLSETPGLGKAVAAHTDDAVEQVEHFCVSCRIHSETCRIRHCLGSIIAAGVGRTQDGPNQWDGVSGARVDYDETREVTDSLDGNVIYGDMSPGRSADYVSSYSNNSIVPALLVGLGPIGCTFSALIEVIG